MNDKTKHSSQLRAAFRDFFKSRRAVVCFVILCVLYGSAVCADFLAPYSYDNEDRNFSYSPPSKIHIIDAAGHLSWPYIYGSTVTLDEYHAAIYREDTSVRYPLRFFQQGDAYRIAGLIPANTRLFGVDAPGRVYLFGADSRGRDVFSRLLYGGRISLSIGLIGVLISFSVGLIVGGIAGYYGGIVDVIIMRICEMFMLVPGFYLMLALRSAIPDTVSSVQVYFAVVVILSCIGWASLARIIRGMSMSLCQRDYVRAAQMMGHSDVSIIVRHILPHTFSYSIVAIMLSIPGYILGEAALSLLGLGIQDPIASWGNMLSDAMAIVQVKFHPWILLPGACIFLVVLSFNIIGDVLRDCLDPLLKGESTHD